jgi:GTP-binding protein
MSIPFRKHKAPVKPIVAIVGRPNVGKSTLFNRLTGHRAALVDDRPGVTRDRLYGDVEWDGRVFTLVDTGGFADADEDRFAESIRRQIDYALIEADLVIVLLDGKGGANPADTMLVNEIRRRTKPFIAAVGKIDDPIHEDRLHDFYHLGIEPLYPVSGLHGFGTGDLLDAVLAEIPEPPAAAPEDDFPEIPSIAVVGRPNAGKSSLINRLLGENRLLVGDTPGTTRDAVDTELTVNEKTYRLVDTAGIRRKSRVRTAVEKYSIVLALKSLDRCDVALVLIDAAGGIGEQDARIAGYAARRGCGCILLLNKWDLVEKTDKTMRQFTERLRHEIKFLPYAPILTVSAKTGQRIQKIFPDVDAVYAQYTKRIQTAAVNRILGEALEKKSPAMHKGRPIKFYYATQVAVKPPTFIAFVNEPQGIHFSYHRYLQNRIREATGLTQTPIRLGFRKRTGRERP